MTIERATLDRGSGRSPAAVREVIDAGRLPAVEYKLRIPAGVLEAIDAGPMPAGSNRADWIRAAIRDKLHRETSDPATVELANRLAK